MPARKIPFPFILDRLHALDPVTKPMFGSYAVYVREKIMLVLRERENHEDANGIWLATSKEHHASLKKEFPSLQSIYILSDGKNETGWQMIPMDADDFESAADHVCDLILKGDQRIGKIPKARKKKKSTLN
ncbi:MAG: hypothetical protein M3R17_15310 [Bacteroidota bacterium]|nr:hypothetical protein [Bacteroidota bacterium]